MSLTAAQQTTLRNDIQSAGNAAALGAFITAKDWVSIASFYNQPSSLQIWRPDLRNSEIVAALVGADVAAIASSGALGLLQTLIIPDLVDATSGNIRTDFSTLFSGKTSLANLTAVAQRTATRIEALFAAGGLPAVSTMFGYALSLDDVQKAMGA